MPESDPVVAAPALAGFVLWTQEQSQLRGLRRLRFLSRDGQVLHELTRRLAPVLGAELDLEYVYSSRLTWSLAATQPDRLADASWLFNSFIKSNAADVCARLCLPLAQYRPTMLACGVSLDPEAHADQLAQAGALLRFVGTPDVARAVGARIEAVRRLVLDYAAQHHLAEADTGLVDIGWTDRMVASLIHVCEAAGTSRPHILFWGHEPRPAIGWTDPDRVGSYVYNTATAQGLGWRVPDAPFVMETFCMGDHGIVSGYHANATGRVEPVLLSPRNDAEEAWGFGCTGRRCTPSVQRSMLTAACPATMCVRSCIRSPTCSGATPHQPRQSPGEHIPMTAIRPGPPYDRSPGHSRSRIVPPVATVRGLRDHWH